MVILSVIYAGVALGYLVFSGLSVLSWKGQPLGMRLIAAAAVTVVWASTNSMKALDLSVPFLVFWLIEVMRNVAWMWFLLGVAQNIVPTPFKKIVTLFCVSAIAAVPIFGLILNLSEIGIVPVRVLSVSGFVLSFLSLVALEQIYRNADAELQNSIRYLVISLGTIFFYDLFMFAQAELLRGVRFNEWLIRGVINAFALPFIAVAARKNDKWSVDIFVSRHMVFYTTAFTAIGAYLIMMAMGGYYLKAVGGAWGVMAQVMFFLVGAIVLIGMIFSASLRRRIKVFISKHFFRNKYEYRIEWLRFIETLSTYGDRDVRQVALSAVCKVMNSEKGMLFILKEEEKKFVIGAGYHCDLNDGGHYYEVAIQEGWVQYISDKSWIIDLREYRFSPDAYQNIKLPEWIVANSEWRLISPVFNLNKMIGFILLNEPPEPFYFTYEDRDLLITLGRHIATHLNQYDVSRKLTESRQFDAFNRLTAYMMHDLKNSAAQMSLLVRNAAKHKHNPDFIDDAITTIDGVARRVENLIEQLRQGSEVSFKQRISLQKTIDKSLGGLVIESPVPKVVSVTDQIFINADLDRLAAVFGHLIRNAQEATPAEGRVDVNIGCNQGLAYVEISDNGTGMDEEFIREKLFRPFQTTKGTKGMGIGMHQARDYIRSLGGDVQVKSILGSGTMVKVSIPLAVD